MTVHMTPAQLKTFLAGGGGKIPLPAPTPPSTKKEWFKKPIVWVIGAFLIGNCSGAGSSGSVVAEMNQVLDQRGVVICLPE